MKIVAFSIPALIVVVFCCHNFSNGFIDYYYTKITNEGNSLIIGTSRASQGIIPDSVMVNTKFEGPMLNFAFSSFDSPFDEGYYNAIKSKLNEATKNGLFIIEVDPFALSSDDKSNLTSHTLKDQFIFHGTPNYEYLYRNVNPFYQLIENRNFHDPSSILHKNGWLELTLPMDSNSINSRANAKLKTLIKTIESSHLASNKIEYLEKTIEFLQAHGKVILIKIPAWPKIIEVENDYAEEIDKEVRKIAANKKVKYYDFTTKSNEYVYVDGNHLDKKSAIKFSSELNKLILEDERTNIH